MVTEVKREQTVMLAILSRMVESADAQTEMLADILRAATQEAGPSEAAPAIAALASAVRENTEAVRAIAAQMAELPGEIGAEVARAMPTEPSA